MPIRINKIDASTESKSIIDSVSEILNKDISLFGNTWSDTHKEQFYTKVHTLLQAGVDIKTVLELSEQSAEKQKIKKSIAQIKNSILQGKALHQAMEESTHFSPFEYYSVKIGEETGRLDSILLELSTYFNTRIQQKRKLVSAFSYPVVVLLTAIAAVWFMLRYLVPMFADVYNRFGGELPLITKYVLALSNAIGNYGIYIILIVIVLLIVFYNSRNSISFRKFSSSILLKLPVIGIMLRLLYTSRFCKSLALMISADIPLNESLNLLKKMIGFYPIESGIDEITSGLMQGNSFAECIAKQDIYPSEMIAMIKVGEEVNQLDNLLHRIGDEYAKQVVHKTEMLNSLLEPVLIIFLGIVIGIILIAMYLPIFKLSTQLM